MRLVGAVKPLKETGLELITQRAFDQDNFHEEWDSSPPDLWDQVVAKVSLRVFSLPSGQSPEPGVFSVRTLRMRRFRISRRCRIGTETATKSGHGRSS